jgi:ATP-dependent DNA helicase RecG
MTLNLLETPIEYLKGVGPSRAELLRKELNISTFWDLLYYYPFRYVDRSKFVKIREIQGDMAYVQLRGRIVDTELVGKGGGMRYVATFRDDTGTMELLWFQGIKWIKDKLDLSKEFVVFGKPGFFNGKINIVHPELEMVSDAESFQGDPLDPVYSTTEKIKQRGFSSKTIGRLVKTLMPMVKGHIPETLPAAIIEDLRFVSHEAALSNIHFPSDTGMLKRAETRLKFEELFFIQLKLLRYKVNRSAKTKGVPFLKIGDYFNVFYHTCLPFQLTNAQKKVLREIRADLGSGHQMNRLLQGDVGSGKTLVALMSMLIALDNGFQACLMAPTEILAAQHFKTICRFLEGLAVKVDLLTGSTKAAQRKGLHKLLQSGELHILIGTHALIEDAVQFSNLGLVVIDEQHRFGVAQRAKLWSKSLQPPHILVMTATPIPRTLAMTVYGDLDVSVIDELPPGRKPILTYHYYDSSRLKVHGFMKQQIALGRQVYVVYPLIEESEAMDLKNLMEGMEGIMNDFPLPEYNVSMVHGRMKAKEKEFEMNRFAKGETQIMVATTVIEVGVDIPNASVMVIENAERFGLSQLHQLRGRVGRGADQSQCILMTSFKLTADGRKRIETMVRTNDGFEISEVDLQLRGPGDLEGTQQSGIMDLRLADIIRDEPMLKYARNLANKILDADPTLADPRNSPLTRKLASMDKGKTMWAAIS